jgi:carboxylesterase type B
MSHEAPEHFGNFGLVDQRHAFPWLQSHIHDCKGDTPNVTAFGVSDGSGSLHLHILSGKPLFNRGILQSDGAPKCRTFALLIPREYMDQALTAEISAETYEERLEKLRWLNQEEIV